MFVGSDVEFSKVRHAELLVAIMGNGLSLNDGIIIAIAAETITTITVLGMQIMIYQQYRLATHVEVRSVFPFEGITDNRGIGIKNEGTSVEMELPVDSQETVVEILVRIVVDIKTAAGPMTVILPFTIFIGKFCLARHGHRSYVMRLTASSLRI